MTTRRLGAVAADAWALSSWRAVVARIPDPHPCATPEWQRAWWEHLGSGALEVVPLRAGGQVVAVAALRRDEDGVLRFLGSRDTMDYPGPAVLPGRAAEAAELLLRALGPTVRGRTVLDLENARPEDGFADALAAAARAAGMRVTVSADEPVARMPLPASWDEYAASLGRHSRHEVARKRRRMARELPAARMRSADARSLEADLRTFFALHRRSRGEKGAFMTPQIEGFMRQLAHATLARRPVAGDGRLVERPAGPALRLDVLEADRGALAVTLGFQGPRTYYLYNMAYDPDASALSPGIVLLAAVIERAIADRLERFDFMRGLERYKLELGGTPSYLTRVRLVAR